MTKRKISITLTSILLLVSLCLAMASCGENQVQERAPVQAENALAVTDVLQTEFVSADGIQLMAVSPMMMSKATNTITQKLSAVITPDNASNKEVDFTVAWADKSNTSDVSKYITITPDREGSPNATVTCYGAFTGNIVITATTRQNAFRAECIVTFVGIPANIEILTSLTPAEDGYHASVGGTYTFETECSNPFAEVGAGYKALNVSVEGVGQIKTGTHEVYNGGGDRWLEGTEEVIDLSTIAAQFIEASISSNGTVTVTVKKSIENYYSSVDRLDSGRTQSYNDAFLEYATPCYFKIVLTEPNSGISTSFNVVIDHTAVNGISLTSNEMLF